MWQLLLSHTAYTQQNSCSISLLLDTVTTQWLDKDSVITVVNYQQHGDYTAISSSVTVLPVIINIDYTVTVSDYTDSDSILCVL